MRRPQPPPAFERIVEPELMDAPDVEPAGHAQALRALARVNALSLGPDRAREAVRRLRRPGPGPVRVLDLACGGGDVAVSLAAWAARRGIDVEVHGVDRSAFAVDWARARAERAGVRARFWRLDVLDSDLPTGYDLAICSLFLHHLDPATAVRFLRAMASAAGSGLVQDLRRSRAGYALAWVALRVLTRSEIARVDGLRSVRAAFTVEEVRTLAREAGLPDPRVTVAWPQRLVLRWASNRPVESGG